MVSTFKPSGSEPPPAPPLPPFPSSYHETSKLVLKTRGTPPAWFSNGSTSGPPPDPSNLPTGAYFVYGTLMDPGMLKDVLHLHEPPRLRPAEIIGYRCRSWGQYPALVDGAMGEIVRGVVFELGYQEHAARLAEYETGSYRLRPVRIRYTDAETPAEDEGWAFVFAGREADLDDSAFDINVWLRRMGRKRGELGED